MRSDLRLLVIAVLLALLVVWLAPCDSEPERSSVGYRVTAAGAASPVEAELIPPISLERTTTTSTTTTTVPPTTSTSSAVANAAPGRDLGVFRVTCYGPPMFPAGQTTASGDPVGPGSIAVDPSVIPLGTRLFVEGYGPGVANDRGSKVRGRHVDLWTSNPYRCPRTSARVRVTG